MESRCTIDMLEKDMVERIEWAREDELAAQLAGTGETYWVTRLFHGKQMMKEDALKTTCGHPEISVMFRAECPSYKRSEYSWLSGKERVELVRMVTGHSKLLLISSCRQLEFIHRRAHRGLKRPRASSPSTTKISCLQQRSQEVAITRARTRMKAG